MELVDGEDLSQRIARGAIPIDEALPIAKQIAEALEAAHEQGIIHRDLKPANIKLRDDGTVKVLDFGLAKALETTTTSTPGVTQSPTITTPAMMTGAGTILGTAAYMSPEQARGKPVDRRADIWAFGAVLFEMLAGIRPFPGEEISDTLAGILKSEPAWEALPRDTSAAMRRLLRRCLEKDRQQRLQHIGDARLEIEEARGATAAEHVAAPAGTVRRPVLWIAAAAATALAVGGIAARQFSIVPEAPCVTEHGVGAAAGGSRGVRRGAREAQAPADGADRDRSRWLTGTVSRVTEHGRDTIDRTNVRRWWTRRVRVGTGLRCGCVESMVSGRSHNADLEASPENGAGLKRHSYTGFSSLCPGRCRAHARLQTCTRVRHGATHGWIGAGSLRPCPRSSPVSC
jgi:protein kinase-like protein